MSQAAKDAVVILDFPGLADNRGPRDLPPGTAEQQVNAVCVVVGELQVRLGLRQVTFEN